MSQLGERTGLKAVFTKQLCHIYQFIFIQVSVLMFDILHIAADQRTEMFSSSLYLFLQPVIVLDDACHGNISALHIESDLSRRLLLNQNTNGSQPTKTGRL